MLIAIIAAAVALCLVTACLGFSFFGGMRRRKHKEHQEAVLEGQADENSKKNSDYSHRNMEDELMDQLSGAPTTSMQSRSVDGGLAVPSGAADSTPPRKSKRKKHPSTLTRTPSTPLAAIEEDIEEDHNSSFDTAPETPLGETPPPPPPQNNRGAAAASMGTNVGGVLMAGHSFDSRDDKSEENSSNIAVKGDNDTDAGDDESEGSYLPKALIGSFDALSQDEDDAPPATSTGPSPTGTPTGTDTTKDKNETAETTADTVVPLQSGGPGMARTTSNDDDSVDSMDQSIDTASLYIEGDDSTLGEDRSIKSRGTLSPVPDIPEDKPVHLPPPSLPNTPPREDRRAMNRRSGPSLSKMAYAPSSDSPQRTPMSRSYREILRTGHPGTPQRPSQEVSQGDSLLSPTMSADDSEDDSLFSTDLNSFGSPPEWTPEVSSRGSYPSDGALNLPSNEDFDEEDTDVARAPTNSDAPSPSPSPSPNQGVWNTLVSSLVKAEHEFFNPTLPTTEKATSETQEKPPATEPEPPRMQYSEEVTDDEEAMNDGEPPKIPQAPSADDIMQDLERHNFTTTTTTTSPLPPTPHPEPRSQRPKPTLEPPM